MLPVQLQLTEYTRAPSKEGQHEHRRHPLAPMNGEECCSDRRLHWTSPSYRIASQHMTQAYLGTARSTAVLTRRQASGFAGN
ncbi:hypothetical protein WJX77_010903 [Trebouxia sp. C0004]